MPARLAMVCTTISIGQSSLQNDLGLGHTDRNRADPTHHRIRRLCGSMPLRSRGCRSTDRTEVVLPSGPFWRQNRMDRRYFVPPVSHLSRCQRAEGGYFWRGYGSYVGQVGDLPGFGPNSLISRSQPTGQEIETPPEVSPNQSGISRGRCNRSRCPPSPPGRGAGGSPVRWTGPGWRPGSNPDPRPYRSALCRRLRG
jgi:hypothetical protein